jgi:hypothetical protein
MYLLESDNPRPKLLLDLPAWVNHDVEQRIIVPGCNERANSAGRKRG